MSTENKNQQEISNNIEADIKLNVKAKEYVPKKKQNQDNKEENSTVINNKTENSDNLKEDDKNNKIDFNLNAKEFVPKKVEGMNVQLVEDDDDEEEVDEDAVLDDLVNQEIDDPIPVDDEDESDEDKWFPKYKECSCCNGYIYKCNGDVCKSLGVCFCKAQEDYDPDI